MSAKLLEQLHDQAYALSLSSQKHGSGTVREELLVAGWQDWVGCIKHLATTTNGRVHGNKCIAASKGR